MQYKEPGKTKIERYSVTEIFIVVNKIYTFIKSCCNACNAVTLWHHKNFKTPNIASQTVTECLSAKFNAW